MLFDDLVFLFHQVPLVNQDYHPFAVPDDQPENIHVLSFHAQCGVDKQQTDIGCLNCPDRPQDRIEFDILLYFSFLSQASCIDQVEIMIILVIPGKNGIPGCSGYGCYNIALLANQ